MFKKKVTENSPLSELDLLKNCVQTSLLKIILLPDQSVLSIGKGQNPGGFEQLHRPTEHIFPSDDFLGKTEDVQISIMICKFQVFPCFYQYTKGC